MYLTSKQIVWFPTTIGLTGKSFKDGQVYFINDFNDQTNDVIIKDYQNDVDNILS
jgi:hypothetical protein